MPTLPKPTQRGLIQLYPPGLLRHLWRIAAFCAAIGLLIGCCWAARP